MRGSPLTILLVIWTALSAEALPILGVPHSFNPPEIKALLEDPIWDAAAVIPSLTLSSGVEAEGLLPVPTKIRVLWNENGIYIRFTCQDERIETPFEGRDKPHYQGDVVEVFLDVSGDSRNYVELQLSPNNQVFDQLITLDALPISENGRLVESFFIQHLKMNPKWDYPKLRTATRRTNNGWIAEIAFPPEAFNLTQWQASSLRAHFIRYDWLDLPTKKRRLIAMNWATVQYGCPHISPEAMGVLKLLPPE